MRPAARAAAGLVVALGAAVLCGCTGAHTEESPMTMLVPQPASLAERGGDPFTITGESRVLASGPGSAAVGEYLAAAFRTATGFPLLVVDADGASDRADAGAHDILIAVRPHDDPHDDRHAGPHSGPHDSAEAYTLRRGADGARIGAGTDEGAFRGVQTLRQLFPAMIEARVQVDREWAAPAVAIEDHPRFAYRGAGLDVVRHFFGVDEVKRYIDDIALVKVNHLHLHLTDDQGWRLEITSWPNLTAFGAASEVGLGSGGFYTQADYAEIVNYAASRFITVVPEIDLPGHTNAALASYPELACDGVAPERYTGVEVGFSTLCIDKPVTYRFVADVVREVAAITPGPYLHLGGDESLATPRGDFIRFIERVTAEASAATGKTIVGWHEMGAATTLPAGTVGQYWGFVQPQDGVAADTLSFIESGGRIIMSPADTAYLDMVYDDDTRWGQAWANGPTPVSEASGWDPAEIVDGVGEEQLLGVEAPIWTETISSVDELEFMAFPRLAAIAEIGWSPRSERDWQQVGPRLVAFSERLASLGIGFHRAPDLPWAP